MFEMSDEFERGWGYIDGGSQRCPNDAELSDLQITRRISLEILAPSITVVMEKRR
jgi:hypothetical protein